jgi:hypothetical protein
MEEYSFKGDAKIGIFDHIYQCSFKWTALSGRRLILQWIFGPSGFVIRITVGRDEGRDLCVA